MKKIDQIDDTVYSYATLRQKEVIDAVVKADGNQSKAAKKLGIAHQSVSDFLTNSINRAAKKGYSPEHDMTKGAPDGFQLKGTSTLYDSDGNAKIQWVKTSIDAQRQQEMMEAIISQMCSSVPSIKPTKAPDYTNNDYMSVYPFGDPHIGLHAWHEDTGEDYDLKIAEGVFNKAMIIAVEKAPPSEIGLIINVGDFFHADNAQNRTERGGNALDVDSRYSKIIRIGVRIMQGLIELALKKHKTVKVVNAKGNHDPHSSQWLAVALDARYHDEPRVEIELNSAEHQYFVFGKVLIGVTHGDKCKPSDLESIMAADKPSEWGMTKHRYWYTGHVHHDQIKEYRGCKFESFRTLAAKDSWHAGAGYRSGRDLKVIVLHKEFGEVERYTIGIDQFQSDAA